MLLDDRAFRLLRRHVRDRLVLVRIEGQPERLHRGQPLRLEDRAELALDEPHALDPGRASELVGDRRERAIVPVEHVEQARDEIRLRELREIGALGLVPLAIVREVRGHALQIIGELANLRIFRRSADVACVVRLRRVALGDRVPIGPRPLALLEELLGAPNLVVHH